MKIKYTGSEELALPTLGLQVKHGETFDAVGDDAKSLLARDYFEKDIQTDTVKKEENK